MMMGMLTGFRDRLTLLPEKGELREKMYLASVQSFCSGLCWNVQVMSRSTSIHGDTLP